MRITNKQLQAMIYWLTLLSGENLPSLTEFGREQVLKLLQDVGNQQSDEIKEIKDEL